MLAPELLILSASSERALVKMSVAEVHELSHKSFSLIRTFYVGSGGFVLRAPGSLESSMTIKQIYCLLLRLPISTEKGIRDKIQADLLANTITVPEPGWLVIQVVARGGLDLPIILLELTTVAFVACTGFTFLFWVSKSPNVDTSTCINNDVDVASILIEAGDATKTLYHDMPLIMSSHNYTH